MVAFKGWVSLDWLPALPHNDSLWLLDRHACLRQKVIDLLSNLSLLHLMQCPSVRDKFRHLIQLAIEELVQ